MVVEVEVVAEAVGVVAEVVGEEAEAEVGQVQYFHTSSLQTTKLYKMQQPLQQANNKMKVVNLLLGSG